MPTRTQRSVRPAHLAAAAHAHRGERRRRALSGIAVGLAVVVLLAGTAAACTRFVDLSLDPPPGTPEAGAVIVTTLLCGLLAHRVGGHVVAAVLFGFAAGATAVFTALPWLLAGVAALTAFAAAVLGVLATRPAKRAGQVVVEYAVALGVALTGALGAAGYSAPVRPDVLGYVVQMAALLTLFWVAHRLGGGLSGLGRRGGLVIASAVAVLAAGTAYSAALQRWGSPGLVAWLERVETGAVDLLGAVPEPLAVLVGFPALVWGLVTRARMRQGWWVCGFGALGTACVATSLASPDVTLAAGLLALLYGGIAGLGLGLLVWKADRMLTGPRGRRARVADRAAPPRPEPARWRPLS